MPPEAHILGGVTWGSQSGVEQSLLLSDGGAGALGLCEVCCVTWVRKIREILRARFRRDRYLEVIVLLPRAERQGGRSGRARGSASGLPTLSACKGGSTGA
jgi:hypothetical protein